MALYTKCILHPVESSDGVRISVMSRHTLSDGVTIDSRITPDTFHEWLSMVAPPARLVGDYYKRGLSWDEFERRYHDYIRSSPIFPIVSELAHRAVEMDLTVLCIEEAPERCHRRLLAQDCQVYVPSLIVVHR